jgi:sialate O-acetylesterase
MKRTKLLFGLLAALLAGEVVLAQVKVPRLVSDGMVLQREMPIRIWGWASPGEKITIKFDGETASGTTDDRGKWVVVLSSKKAGGPYAMDINGINHIWLKNIMVGEVWVCGGQSNMELPMERVKDKYPDVIAHSDNSSIRQFKVPQRYDSTGPRENLSGGKWEAASPATVPGFSAVAYFFARELNEQYHVPVGLINTAAGDQPDEAWMSTNGSGLYNGMIAPLINGTIRGVIWYSGEANVPAASEYHTSFPLLIADWRRRWNQGVFPFLFVQLAGYGAVKDQAGESDRAVLREAQRMALAAPKTGMAVALDLGESNDSHPLNKADVGKRLELAAEHIAYGRGNTIWTGPMYHSMKVKGNRVHVHFNEVENGLIVKGGGELQGFAVAGADNHFVPAKAVIEGKNVVVAWSEAVPNPVAVRYAWADNPQGANLYNRDILFNDGLPAPAFAGRVK